MTDQEPRKGLGKLFDLDRLPDKVFGGRMRTSTFILILAWIIAYIANAQLNWDETQSVAPAANNETSVTEQDTPPSAVTMTPTPVPTTTEVASSTLPSPSLSEGSPLSETPSESALTSTLVPGAPAPGNFGDTATTEPTAVSSVATTPTTPTAGTG